MFKKIDVDLREYPKDRKRVDKFGVGDTHANIVNVIYQLTKNMVWDLSEVDYQALFKLYESYIPGKNEKACFSKFDEIIGRQKVYGESNAKFILYHGDVFADRGKNDYFMVGMCDWLNSHKIAYGIIIGNHDIDFFAAYKAGEFRTRTRNELLLNKLQTKKAFDIKFSSVTHLENGHNTSLKNMIKSITRGNIDGDKVIGIIENVITPMLHLFVADYDDGTKQIRFHSHAPVVFKIFNAICNKSTGQKFQAPKTIVKQTQEINNKFRGDIMNKDKEIWDIFDRKTCDAFYDAKNSDYKPLRGSLHENPEQVSLEVCQAAVTWEREPGSYKNGNKLLDKFKECKLLIIHGHTWSWNDTYICLDSDLGKGSGSLNDCLKLYILNQVPASCVNKQVPGGLQSSGRTFFPASTDEAELTEREPEKSSGRDGYSRLLNNDSDGGDTSGYPKDDQDLTKCCVPEKCCVIL